MRLKKFYDSQAGEATMVTGRVRKVARLFQRHLTSTQRLLDVGCGVGNIAVYLKKTTGAAEAHGVEISENHAEQARQRGVKAAVLDINVDPLPFADGFFDAIFCGEVIEHLFDTDHMLDEMYRVLSPRGVCVLTTPNLAAWYNRLTLLLGFQPFYTQVSFHHPVGRLPLVGGFGAGGHLRVFTLPALKGLVRLSGFRILQSTGAGIQDMDLPSEMPWLQRAVAPIDRLFTYWPSLACDMILVLAKD